MPAARFAKIFMVLSPKCKVGFTITGSTWGTRRRSRRQILSDPSTVISTPSTVCLAKAISAKCLVALTGLKTTLAGLMGTGFTSTIASWGGAILGLVGKVTALALELKILWDEANIFKEFYDKGVHESIYGWKEDIKEGEDVGWLKRLVVWFGTKVEEATDWVYDKTHDKVVVPSVPRVANNTTSTTNSNNTIYVQMPYEQAVRYTRDVTGREPMMSVAPGGFGGNVQ